MPEANEPNWITTGEAAKILGASISTVRRLADDGTLPCERRKTWSRRTEDSHGRPLRGHRRVREDAVRLLANMSRQRSEVREEKS